MKKIFTLFFIAAAISAQAQYLPNGSFGEWKGSAGDSYQSSSGGGMRQRPGDEPSSWNGSSVNQKVMGIEKQATLLFEQETDYDGSAGSSVKMRNAWVGVDLGFYKIGSNAPAFINLGTPWVYAVSDVSKCDGGVYGGMEFVHRPDAIEGWYRRSGGTGESARIIVYLWNGTFKSTIASASSNDVRDDVDRAVMGKTSSLQQSGTLIASCDYAFSATANDGWQKITVPLEYVAGTESTAPEKVNVIISSGDYWTRSNIKDGSALEADDVRFVYYSELASLVYDGKEYFVQGESGFELPGEYDESKLVVASNGAGATVEKSFDAEANVLTITIKGNDYAANSSNVHVYTVTFGADVVDPTPDPDPDPNPDGDVDYTPAYTGVKSNQGRWIEAVTLESLAYAGDESNTMVVDNNTNLCYNDYTGTVVMKASPGETVRVDVNVGRTSWMNAFVYIDNDGDGFSAGILEESDWQPVGDLVSYSFYNNDASSDEAGWNSAGVAISGDSRSTVELPSFDVPDAPGLYRMRVKLDWCNIDPDGDRDGKFGDFMDNGGQIVDFMLEVSGSAPAPDPEPEPEPEPDGDVDYTPAFTGVKTRTGRWVESIALASEAYLDSESNVLVVDNSSNLCFNDYSGTVAMNAAPGETVMVSVNIGDASWMHAYVYIDAASDGFTASIAEGSEWQPVEDLVSYSFYNNDASSDEAGWNSAGVAISGDSRSTVELPSFDVPDAPGLYRMRVKLDWCSIDPNGDRDGKFGDFMDNGGQIVDFMLCVSDPTGIGTVEVEGRDNLIYDLSGRRVQDMSVPGLYIINGKKVLVK